MAILFLGWLVESYDIGLTGSVLPSLTALYHLNTGLKSAVSISSSAGVVLGIVPAGFLADRVGRKRVMVGGTVVYSILTFLTGFAPYRRGHRPAGAGRHRDGGRLPAAVRVRG